MRKGITHLISETRPSPTTGAAFFLLSTWNVFVPFHTAPRSDYYLHPRSLTVDASSALFGGSYNIHFCEQIVNKNP
jgi:hypothetical protein